MSQVDLAKKYNKGWVALISTSKNKNVFTDKLYAYELPRMADNRYAVD